MRVGRANGADVIEHAVSGHGRRGTSALGEAGQPGGEARLAASRTPLVVLLRGAPGVGKSTAAVLLGAQKAIHTIVEVDAIRRMLVGVDWGDRRQHDAAMAAAVRAAVTFAAAGFGPVLLVDCFGRDHAQRTSELVRRGGAEAELITLWASPEALRARLALRTDDYKEARMALLLNDEIRDSGSAAIDTTELTAAQVAGRILACLERLP